MTHEKKVFIEFNPLMEEKDFLASHDINRKFALNYKRLFEEYIYVYNLLVSTGKNFSIDKDDSTAFIKNMGYLGSKLTNYYDQIEKLSKMATNIGEFFSIIKNNHTALMKELKEIGLKFSTREIGK
jgi:hypothetical protein